MSCSSNHSKWLKSSMDKPLKMWRPGCSRGSPSRWTILSAGGLQRPVSNIVLVGGIFANVELNRVLLETGGEQYYIFPHMGDGGLAMGAAMLAVHREHSWSPRPLTSLALGPDLDETKIESEACTQGWTPMPLAHSPEQELAMRLAKGQTVARAVGRMEYGPRALGQRSILAPATDRAIHTDLNGRLKRTETMPFAPVMLIEDLDRWVTGAHSARHALPWMTVNVKAKPEAHRLCPAVVHVDGTLRPQVVSAKTTQNCINCSTNTDRKQGYLHSSTPPSTCMNTRSLEPLKTQSWPHSRPLSTAFRGIQSTKSTVEFFCTRVFFAAKLFTCQ